MNKLLIPFFLCFTLNQIFAQKTDSISNKLTQELEEIHTQGFINGFSVAIVNQKGTLYNKGFGFSNVKENRPYTENTLQNIASISKTFIGISLLKAQELGKLHLDDPINKYLPFTVLNPNFPDVEITIRQLATHTSSIKDPARYQRNGYILKEENSAEAKPKSYFRPSEQMMPLGTFLEKILNENGEWYKKSNFLKKKPGDAFEYSNVAAGLAAYIIEVATETPFPVFTQFHIFKPLEMNDSGWRFEDIDFSKHTKIYFDSETEMAFYSLVTYPDGGLITSSSDLEKYLVELIKGYNGRGTILKKSSYQELYKQHLSASNFEKRNESAFNDEYNSGIFMGFSAKDYIGHTGSDPGVATFMFFNSSTLVGKILLVNTELKKEGIQEFINIWTKLQEYENQLHKEK